MRGPGESYSDAILPDRGPELGGGGRNHPLAVSRG
jgi:hypothetical protein